MALNNYVTNDDYNLILQLVKNAEDDFKIEENNLLQKINTKCANHDGYLINTSYMNVLLFIIQVISEHTNFDYISNHKIVETIINKNSPVKISEEKEVKNSIYKIIRLELGKNFGILVTFKDTKSPNIFSWEFID